MPASNAASNEKRFYDEDEESESAVARGRIHIEPAV